MGNTSDNRESVPAGGKGGHICLGVLAHVDAGKTTLAESMLYLSGAIRKLGRVDHRDAFLDTYELERARGITIFSKQARLEMGPWEVTLLDTPGHVDFSAEMERTLQVLDYAVLVISGADGVQGHVRTLWRLLTRYRIPVFLFINKMDQEGTDREALMRELQSQLDSRCVEFGTPEESEGEESFLENLAVCDEAVLECYLEEGTLSGEQIADLIAGRKVFPCYFGSALKLQGVDSLMEGLRRHMRRPQYPQEFGARVYKIGRDAQGNRMTYLKITGGVLRVRMNLSGKTASGGRQEPETWEEKVSQIRMYSGAGFQAVPEAAAGSVCAVTGLTRTYAGEGLGCCREAELPLLEPVLTYRIRLPEECDAHRMLLNLRQLEEEEPELHIVWEEQTGEIHAQVMGEVQIEVLKSLIKERFGVLVEFSEGSIVYKETISAPGEGVGHFEPLRHYAEVHLLLEPGEPGSGLQFDTVCSTDLLDRNWQRLVLTHLEEKHHRGVLTGAEITDMKITLLAGRAHLKHTEGGDFRQATYRAVRHGLKKAAQQGACVLLEPVYEFRLELPPESLGRAMTDIQKMQGSFREPQIEEQTAVLTGSAPVVHMRGYQREVTAYTRGSGRLFCTLKGYEPCQNAEEVLERCGYDSERDTENPTGSVFCSHGAGFVVSWEHVEDYMHLAAGILGGSEEEALREQLLGLGNHLPAGGNPESARAARERAYGAGEQPQLAACQAAGGEGRILGGTAGMGGLEHTGGKPAEAGRKKGESARFWAGEKELEEIFTRTYGRAKRGPNAFAPSASALGGAKKDPGAQAASGRTGGEQTGSPGQETAGAKRSRGPAQAILETGKKHGREYLLVDGYNIIFAWDDLRELAAVNIESARNKLMDILSDYQGFRKMTLILVFDAYKVEGGTGGIFRYHNIHVVYTKEAETADQYIEKTVHEIGRKHCVTVATSDAMEQVIILGQGAHRLSAAGLWEEIRLAREEMRAGYLKRRAAGGKNYLFDHLPEELAEAMEEVRLGKKTPEEIPGSSR